MNVKNKYFLNDYLGGVKQSQHRPVQALRVPGG
jgi:hypothetical protein